MTGPTFNELIRAAAGCGPVPERDEPVGQPVGDVGIGRGSGSDATLRPGESDLINQQLRVAASVVRGVVPLDLVIGNL
jgi:hypothetical protein